LFTRLLFLSVRRFLTLFLKNIINLINCNKSSIIAGFSSTNLVHSGLNKANSNKVLVTIYIGLTKYVDFQGIDV
jgi:hypothetical protein